VKHKIKSLISYFVGVLSPIEKEFSVKDLSIFFSVLIATLTLKKYQSKSGNLRITFSVYHSEFKPEIQLVKQRFPELIKTFLTIESRLNPELLLTVFEKLKDVFEKTDEDLDDIISWSYQF
jgi:hypothetical protein